MSDNDKWPTSGPDFNAWNKDLPRFIAMLDEAKGSGFWTFDFDLKYLTIRIDTRDNGWLLFMDGKNGGHKERVDPQRVVDAIEKWRTRHGNVRPYANMCAEGNQ